MLNTHNIKTKLYIIPTVISDDKIETIPVHTKTIIFSLRHFITERNRTARRFIKKCNPPFRIDELLMEEINDNLKSQTGKGKQKLVPDNLFASPIKVSEVEIKELERKGKRKFPNLFDIKVDRIGNYDTILA